MRYKDLHSHIDEQERMDEFSERIERWSIVAAFAIVAGVIMAICVMLYRCGGTVAGQ